MKPTKDQLAIILSSERGVMGKELKGSDIQGEGEGREIIYYAKEENYSAG